MKLSFDSYVIITTHLVLTILLLILIIGIIQLSMTGYFLKSKNKGRQSTFPHLFFIITSLLALFGAIWVMKYSLINLYAWTNFSLVYPILDDAFFNQLWNQLFQTKADYFNVIKVMVIWYEMWLEEIILYGKCIVVMVFQVSPETLHFSSPTWMPKYYGLKLPAFYCGYVHIPKNAFNLSLFDASLVWKTGLVVGSAIFFLLILYPYLWAKGYQLFLSYKLKFR